MYNIFMYLMIHNVKFILIICMLYLHILSKNYILIYFIDFKMNKNYVNFIYIYSIYIFINIL